MITNKPERFAFVCTPRTASRSITRGLLAIDGCEATHFHHDRNVPEWAEVVAAVVRNPFDRLKGTWWNYIRRTRWTPEGDPRFPNYASFLDWCQESNWHMVCSQDEFLPSSVTHTVKFEDIGNNQLPADAPGLLSGLRILHLGKSTQRIPDFEDEYISVIVDRHKADFERFGYEITVPAGINT